MHPSFDEPWKEFNGELPITATVRKFTRGKLEGSELSHAVMRPDQFADNRQAEVAAGRPRRVKEREERGYLSPLSAASGAHRGFRMRRPSVACGRLYLLFW